MVLYVGRMDPYKNVAGLVRAFAVLHEKLQGNIRLIIVGKIDPRFTEPQFEVQRLGLGAAVRFTGHIPDHELQSLYRQAALLAFPSLYEGFGLPPLEAMRHDVPVVASDRSCIPEVLGDAAILIDPTDPKSFADAMHTLIANPPIAADLRKRGRGRVELYSVVEQARQTMEVYQSLLRP